MHRITSLIAYHAYMILPDRMAFSRVGMWLLPRAGCHAHHYADERSRRIVELESEVARLKKLVAASDADHECVGPLPF